MSNDKPRDTSEKVAIPQHDTGVEVVKTGSALDVILWIVALVLLLGATQINQYLPQYFPEAGNIWVRIAVIAACIVVALGLLYATHQGKSFVQLVKDSQFELSRRITWPTKQETVSTTWYVLIVVVITSLALWGFDTLLGWAMKLIIG